MKKTILVIMAAAAISVIHAADWADADGSCFKKGDMNGGVGLKF